MKKFSTSEIPKLLICFILFYFFNIFVNIHFVSRKENITLTHFLLQMDIYKLKFIETEKVIKIKWHLKFQR